MKTVQSSSGSQLLTGYLAGFGAIVFRVLSASCVQALQGAIPDFQLSAIRSTIQGLTYFIGGLIVATDFTVKREYVPGLIYCGAAFLSFNVGVYGASTYLPLGEVQGIVTIVSIVFALAQSKLLFKIDIAKSIIIATLVCAIGIVLTVQPPWLFQNMSSTADTMTTRFMNTSFTSTNYRYSVSSRDVMAGYILSIIGGAGLGVIFDITGIILHNVKTITKATYTMLMCTVGSVAFMFYLEDPVYVLDLNQFMFALGHGLLSAATSFLNIYASSIVPGPSLSIVYSLDVVTALISQYTIMHSIKPGNYNWIEVLGCIIIVFGASIPGVIDILAHKAKANELP